MICPYCRTHGNATYTCRRCGRRIPLRPSRREIVDAQEDAERYRRALGMLLEDEDSPWERDFRRRYA